MEGYIKLHRQILESSIFSSQIGFKIWIWCLLKANFKDKYASVKIGKGESQVHIKRGSFIFGRFKAEDELNIDGSTIYKWIKKLEEENMILVKSNSHYSIVTICKYDEYQQQDNDEVATIQQPFNSQVATIQQQSNTTKNDKNDKNDKEIGPKGKAENNSSNIFSFEDFWEAYNKKVEKKKCQNKFESISNSDKQIISEHVKKYVASTPDVQFRKNPLTYLNGECWHDEIITKQNTQLSITQFSGKYEEF